MSISPPTTIRLLAFSLLAHFLFFVGVSFNFKTSPEANIIDTVYFLGPILSQADFKLETAFKTGDNIYPLQLGKIKPKMHSYIKPASPKPFNSAQAIPGYSKRLNKFLVIEKNVAAKSQKKLGGFEPPKWEKIELRLKAE